MHKTMAFVHNCINYQYREVNMAMTISIDDTRKREFSEACTEIGITASAAFNVFAKAVVREKRIPFELRSESRDEMEAKTRGQRVAEGVRRGCEEIASGRYVTREGYERDRTRRRDAV